MKNILKNVLGALSILMILPSFTFAVEDTPEVIQSLDKALATVESEEDFNLQINNLITDNSEDLINSLTSIDWATLLEDGAIALTGGFIIALVVSLICGLFTYIYTAITLSKIAKRLDEPNGWFAWIPFLNCVLALRLGELSPWLILLVLIPGIGSIAFLVVMVIATMNTCGRRGYDRALGLLYLVPVANLILYGVLAWGGKGK
ncbi:hypothetical protein J6Z48_01345 [bacterium]|nr:hypothetical protein [bacterium]